MEPTSVSRRDVIKWTSAGLGGLAFAAGLESPAAGEVDEKGGLEITVTEPDSRAPVPCRVHLKDPAGKPVQPKGLPFWRDHFVCPGTVQLDLAAGTYAYEIERGPEYARAVGKVEVKENETATASVKLERLVNLTAEGWWPGELHVHRPVEDIELLMKAEDLYLAPVITWWNNRNLWANADAPPDRLLHTFDGKRVYHVMAGEDEREGGALLYFNLPRPLPIAGADREFPSPVKFLSEARAAKDVWVDIEKPFWWDVPVWLATGQVDSIGIANNHMWRGRMYEASAGRNTDEAWGKPRDMQKLPRPLGNGFWSQEIYYHILNCGLRLPPSAGSASGVLPNPVGYNRVYVHTGSDFSYDHWFAGLRAGRCFVTNGPLLRAEANGNLPGHVFKAEDGGALVVELTAKLRSRDPIRVIEVIQNGEVVHKVSFADFERTGSLGKLEFRTSGWFLVRALTDDPRTFCFASTAPWYVEIGSAKRRVSKQSAQFFVDWVLERQARIKIDDEAKREAVLKPHLQAEDYWRKVLASANADYTCPIIYQRKRYVITSHLSSQLSRTCAITYCLVLLIVATVPTECLSQTMPRYQLADHPGFASAIAISASSDLLATGCQENGEVIIYQLGSGLTVEKIKCGVGGIYAMAFSKDGKQIAVSGPARRIEVWDVDTRKQTALLLLGKSYARAICPGNNQSFVFEEVSGLPQKITTWHYATKKVETSLKDLPSTYAALALTRNARYALLGTDFGVQQYDMENGWREVREFKHEEGAYSIALSDKEAFIACAAASVPSEVVIWEIASGKEQARLVAGAGEAWMHIEFLPRTPPALAISVYRGPERESQIIILDCARGKEIRRRTVEKSKIMKFAASPDGKSVAVGYYDGRVHVFDVDRLIE